MRFGAPERAEYPGRSAKCNRTIGESLQMQRRDSLKSTVAAEIGIGKAQAKVPAHNWGKFDFGSGPQVTDRLNQGPFPQYPPDAVIPTDDVVMTTTSL